MAVNQSQVDHIISTASADDPEVRLLKLQDEVDLLKTSIKRLLIDIRERMNDLDNPFNIPSGREQVATGGRTDVRVDVGTSSPAHEGEGTPGKPGGESGSGQPQVQNASPVQFPSVPDKSSLNPGSDSAQEQEFISSFMQAGRMHPAANFAAAKPEKGDEKIRLKKVFRLFAWTTKNVKQFGHDRVDLMLESYRAMGYISDEACALVKDITRLMPNSLGEQHEIQAEEFVRELYELNHILEPGDMSLDRDMIEVFMQQKPSVQGERESSEALTTPGEEIQSENLARKKDRI